MEIFPKLVLEGLNHTNVGSGHMDGYRQQLKGWQTTKSHPTSEFTYSPNIDVASKTHESCPIVL